LVVKLFILLLIASGGKEGNYLEDTPHDALDVYGKTKSLGEPENCTVIRTSIIGEEINNSRSLVEWIKSRKDLDANGFTNHKWNGVTCLELAKCIDSIIKNNNFWSGVRHVLSPTSVTKDVLLKLINDRYNLNITINNTAAATPCDRSLGSNHKNEYKVLELVDQINEMYLYEKR
jgi:dTDP-4-dehydrorhamnose reductase